MVNKQRGFTIVELLIVIVVIAILAAISIVAYNGIQQRANNTSRIVAGKQFVQLFQLYQGTFGSYPSQIYPPGPGFCLGTGFPVGHLDVPRCRSYKSGGSYSTPLPRGPTQPDSVPESDNTALMSELKKVGSIPANPIPTASKVAVGPYLDYDEATLKPIVVVVLDGQISAGTTCGGIFKSVGISSTYDLTYCTHILTD